MKPRDTRWSPFQENIMEWKKQAKPWVKNNVGTVSWIQLQVDLGSLGKQEGFVAEVAKES